MRRASPNRSYTISGNPTGPPAFGLIPGTADSDSEYFIVPNFGLNRQLGANSTLGGTLFGQGGMNTDYPTNTFFGSSPTGVNPSQLFTVPTWAMKDGSGRHAFGVGVGVIVAYQQFEVEAVQAFAPFSHNRAALSSNGADDSLGCSARFGSPGRCGTFSSGASCRSKVSMDEFADYAALFTEGGGFDIAANLGGAPGMGARGGTDG